MLWSVRISLALFFAAAPLVVSGADFWKVKQPSEWSAKQVRRLLTNSPWAKEVTLEMGSSVGSGVMPGGRAGGGRRGGGMAGMGRGMAGTGIGSAETSSGPGGGPSDPGGFGGGGGASMASPPTVIVRWETAAPVREALRSAEVPWSARVAEWEQQFYVITVSRLPFGGRRQMDPDRAKQMQERLRSSASLAAEDKQPVAAERVFMANAPDGATLIFLFARSAALSPDDKEVVFHTGGGPMQVKAKFRLREMAYQGKLSL